MTDHAANATSETTAESPAKEANWDHEGRTSFGRFSGPASWGRKNRYEVFGESTVKGEHPPRFRLVVHGVSGQHSGEETTVEKLPEGGMEISNEVLFSELGELMQDMIKSLADVGRNGLVRGWNSGLQRGFAQGHKAGVAEEKDRAAGVRRAQGEASRAAYDAVQAEASETGRDPADIRREHVTRLVEERGAPKTGRGQGA